MSGYYVVEEILFNYLLDSLVTVHTSCETLGEHHVKQIVWYMQKNVSVQKRCSYISVLIVEEILLMINYQVFRTIVGVF